VSRDARRDEPASCRGGWIADALEDVHEIGSTEVEEKIKLGGHHRGRYVMVNGDDVQVPAIDSKNVSGGKLTGGDSHGDLAANS
jgi:hypothetical protein